MLGLPAVSLFFHPVPREGTSGRLRGFGTWDLWDQEGHEGLWVSVVMKTGPGSCQAPGPSLWSPATQYGQRWGRWGSCVARKWGPRWPARSAVHGTLSPVGKTEGSAQGIRSWGWKGVGRREGALQRGRWRGCCSREGAGHSHSPTTHWADSFEQPTDPSEVAPVKGETKNISCVAGVQPRLIQGIRRGDGVGDLI